MAAAPAAPVPAEIWKEFSGDAAFAHVKRLVDFGPRPSGSEALEKTRKYIVDAMRENGWRIVEQKFSDLTPRGEVTFVNLIGRYGNGGPGAVPDTAQRVIIASHYDTKIFDTIQFLGADDGGSSTGALIELARVLARDPELARRTELVFFDGEEAVVQFTETDGLYGSRHYAKELRESGRNRQFKFGILWDMIGPADLDIGLPTDSPPDLARDVFSAADALGVRKFFSYFRSPILDDHEPLNLSHIPTIDLIDLSFIYWHTADDTMDKLSPASLQKVGAVTLYMLRHLDTR
jgi:glutaminyl-peptide cyclotransferase